MGLDVLSDAASEDSLACLSDMEESALPIVAPVDVDCPMEATRKGANWRRRAAKEEPLANRFVALAKAGVGQSVHMSRLTIVPLFKGFMLFTLLPSLPRWSMTER